MSTMTATTAAPRRGEQAVDGGAIRPFRVDVPEAELTDLRRRIQATRWPERETVPDQSQGTQLETVRELARYWADEYDWRKIESRINSFPHFITEIDGLDFHFVHVRSKHENATPVLVAHGWPGSIIEQMKLIEPLTDPTAHGGASRTPSTSSSRRCPATGTRASRPRPAGAPPASHGPTAS